MSGARSLPNPSATSAIPALSQIWQRLLQVPTIAPDDNFFELGGDSALAVQLFGEIADLYGRRLPPVMIYHVPTISSLATLLEERSAPELSPLITLKDGDHPTPIYIASGLGGGPAEFFQLVKHLRVPHPVYGLQPKGIEGFDEPCERIEDMADFYLRAILQFQPHGPYILAGYSLGGLVALEMARSLSRKGEKIASLVMIDSYPDSNRLARGQFLRLLAQRLKRRVTNFGRTPRTEIRLGGLPNEEAISRFAPALDRVKQAAYKALRSYEPEPYSGAVTFIRAEETTDFPEDPRAVWSALLPNLTVRTVPGDHLAMLTTHYEKLASVLNNELS